MHNLEKSLYIRILIWAYKNSKKGFKEEELFEKFDLKDMESKKWYIKVFRNSPDLLIDNINLSTELTARWSLTALGMSYAINYLGLKEAQKDGERAERLALISIWVSVTVGIVQIIQSFFP